MRLRHTAFRDVGFARAACTDCAWAAGDPVRSRVEYKARKHLEQHDHTVIIERRQRKVVERAQAGE